MNRKLCKTQNPLLLLLLPMPILHSPLPIPSFLRPFPHSRTLISPSLPLKPVRNALPLTALRCSNSLPTTEQELLEAIARSDGEPILPCVRTYEVDLARFTLVGAVRFEQALTAAAADGGGAADEHVGAGMEAMVVETVFPGPPEDRSSVSTRLFLPARKVKEKARKLRRSLSKEMLSSTPSRNILAMTFRQVVLQQLWNFQLVVFGPGALRNMEDLESPREVAASFALSSSDDRVISVLGEALCLLALQSTEDHFLDSSYGRSSNSFFSWSRQPKEVRSGDSSVIIYKLHEDEIVGHAKNLVESFKSTKQNLKHINSKCKNFGWTPPIQTKLEKIGGPEFSAWLEEYVPVYRLQVDSERLEDLKLQGWQQLSQDRWEVVLSHSQMVGLTNMLDMFYEDTYTLPTKELPCTMVVNTSFASNTKLHSSLMPLLPIVLAVGMLIIAIRVFGQAHTPQVQKLVKCLREHRMLPSSSETIA